MGAVSEAQELPLLQDWADKGTTCPRPSGPCSVPRRRSDVLGPSSAVFCVPPRLLRFRPRLFWIPLEAVSSSTAPIRSEALSGPVLRPSRRARGGVRIGPNAPQIGPLHETVSEDSPFAGGVRVVRRGGVRTVSSLRRRLTLDGFSRTALTSCRISTFSRDPVTSLRGSLCKGDDLDGCRAPGLMMRGFVLRVVGKVAQPR
mmetsp:Transcript_22849/g.79433  ORF Transcript_22849/g.79433 Transcript_22849/m.79433 type:complete len:201 (-) Transcript_22849:202-804(-)